MLESSVSLLEVSEPIAVSSSIFMKNKTKLNT